MIDYESRSAETVNFLKTIYFDYPKWVPCRVGLMPATWMKRREKLEDLVLKHPRLFPEYIKGSRDFDYIYNPLYESGTHVDCWGVVWKNISRGLDSIPVSHPLEDWSDFDHYIPPDPLKDDMFGPRDWNKIEQELKEKKKKGGLAVGRELPHGFMFMKLYYLRGFENLMLDMATGEPLLDSLISMVEDYNSAVIEKLLNLGAEYMHFGDDLGMQRSLPISPAMWRQYLKPAYDRMFRPCREAQVPIYFHSDGHILEIIQDLIDVGVTIVNPQSGANGMDNLAKIVKGKAAVDLDLDRQIFPFASPDKIREHIRQAYEKFYMPEGGFMLYAECEPDVPLENIQAICVEFEEIMSA